MSEMRGNQGWGVATIVNRRIAVGSILLGVHADSDTLCGDRDQIQGNMRLAPSPFATLS